MPPNFILIQRGVGSTTGLIPARGWRLDRAEREEGDCSSIRVRLPVFQLHHALYRAIIALLADMANFSNKGAVAHGTDFAVSCSTVQYTAIPCAEVHWPCKATGLCWGARWSERLAGSIAGRAAETVQQAPAQS